MNNNSTVQKKIQSNPTILLSGPLYDVRNKADPLGRRVKDSEICTREILSEVMFKSEKPFDLWDGRTARVMLTNETIDWVLGLANWKVSVSLTFRDDKPQDSAVRELKDLIRLLNKDLVGCSHTSRLVGHSYFSYAYGTEQQLRDVIHFHFLADKALNFKLIHDYWNYRNGFCWTDIIRSKEDCVSYISKYNLKGGEIEIYKDNKNFCPDVIPSWWKADNIRGSQFQLQS